MSDATSALAARETGASRARIHLQAAGVRAAQTSRRLWRAFWDYQARRATAMILHALDERALADIGLQRSEILSAVFGSPPHRARPYHSGWNVRARG